MTVQACYEAIEGDWATVIGVLENEVRVRRYLMRFLNDPTARVLFRALREERWEDAFRAAHTLKGLCRGLGLTRLQSACIRLTDALRGGRAPEPALMAAVIAEYEGVMRVLDELADPA